MECDQLRQMILSESMTYAVSGCIVGCPVGLPLNVSFHRMVIERYWGVGWSVPWIELGTILAVVLLSSVLAAGRPYQRLISCPLRTVMDGE